MNQSRISLCILMLCSDPLFMFWNTLNVVQWTHQTPAWLFLLAAVETELFEDSATAESLRSVALTKCLKVNACAKSTRNPLFQSDPSTHIAPIPPKKSEILSGKSKNSHRESGSSPELSKLLEIVSPRWKLVLFFSRGSDRIRESSVRVLVREKNGSKERKFRKFQKHFLQLLITDQIRFQCFVFRWSSPESFKQCADREMWQKSTGNQKFKVRKKNCENFFFIKENFQGEKAFRESVLEGFAFHAEGKLLLENLAWSFVLW